MGILDNIASRLGYFKTMDVDDPAPWLLATAGAEKYSMPTGELWRNQAELYQRLSWVQIAVSTVSQSVAGVPFSVKTLVDEEEQEITNHPFELLLNKPNPLMSRFEFLEATA